MEQESRFRRDHGIDKYNFMCKICIVNKELYEYIKLALCTVVYENANLIKFVIQANIFHLLNISPRLVSLFICK